MQVFSFASCFVYVPFLYLLGNHSFSWVTALLTTKWTVEMSTRCAQLRLMKSCQHVSLKTSLNHN